MSQGSIIKREGKDGAVSWLLKYDAERDAQGKRQQRYKTVHGTKKAAEKELRHLLLQVDQGTHVKPEKLTVKDWVGTWLESLKLRVLGKTMTQRTMEGYADWLNLHVVPTLGSKELQKLNASDIDTLYGKLMTSGHLGSVAKDAPKVDRGLSSGSVLHVHRVLSQCLKAAKKRRLIVHNPAEDATAPEPPKPLTNTTGEDGAQRVKALDAKQISTLLAAFKGRPMYTLVYTGLATGMRCGEMLALRWSCIDLDKGTLRVVRSVERSKTGLRVKEPKNDSSTRTITIDSDLCDLLRTHRTEQKALALKLGTPYPADCLVFPCVIKRPQGRQPKDGIVNPEVDFNRVQDPVTTSKEFTRVARGAGFVGFSMHGLRHTHATQLLINGESLHVVSKRLGHSTPVITMTTYAHVLKNADEQAANVMGNVLRGALAS